MQPASGVLVQEVEGQTMLLDMEGARYYALDPVGTRFWQLLEEHRDLEAITAAMLAQFDVDEDRLRGDLERLVDELRVAGLVTTPDPPG